MVQLPNHAGGSLVALLAAGIVLGSATSATIAQPSELPRWDVVDLPQWDLPGRQPVFAVVAEDASPGNLERDLFMTVTCTGPHRAVQLYMMTPGFIPGGRVVVDLDDGRHVTGIASRNGQVAFIPCNGPTATARDQRYFCRGVMRGETIGFTLDRGFGNRLPYTFKVGSGRAAGGSWFADCPREWRVP